MAVQAGIPPCRFQVGPSCMQRPEIGFDIELMRHHLYWPGNKTISFECNMYFAAAERLEGEAMDVPTSRTSNFEAHKFWGAHHAIACAPTIGTTLCTCISPHHLGWLLTGFSLTSLVLGWCKPSWIVLLLQVGVSIASSHPSDPPIPRGILVPSGVMWERQSQPISPLVHGQLKPAALRLGWVQNGLTVLYSSGWYRRFRRAQFTESGQGKTQVWLWLTTVGAGGSVTRNIILVDVFHENTTYFEYFIRMGASFYQLLPYDSWLPCIILLYAKAMDLSLS